MASFRNSLLIIKVLRVKTAKITRGNNIRASFAFLHRALGYAYTRHSPTQAHYAHTPPRAKARSFHFLTSSFSLIIIVDEKICFNFFLRIKRIKTLIYRAACNRLYDFTFLISLLSSERTCVELQDYIFFLDRVKRFFALAERSKLVELGRRPAGRLVVVIIIVCASEYQ